MISKELLSKVLKVEIDENYFGMYGSMVEFHKYGSINIYELAHKCKEWAFINGYRISSQYVTKGEFTSSWAKVHNLISADADFVYKTNSDTEPEAIFKACQLILDNKDK